MSDKNFDAYEYAGVIAPGTALVFGGLLLFPDLNLFSSERGFTVGDFGVFLLLTFVVGHLVQVVGTIMSDAWWYLWGGIPSDWVTSKPDDLLARTQIEKLETKVENDFNVQGGLSSVADGGWHPVTRQIYVKVNSAGRSARVDTFNRTYGVMRGISAAFLLLAVLVLAADIQNWSIALALAVVGLLALTRMHRFGVHYARELFVQYLEL